MSETLETKSITLGAESPVDIYEQLVNQRETGPLQTVSISSELITHLHGIMFDIDPKNFHKSNIIPEVPIEPREFYETVLKAWLGRNPVLSKAEVRISGTGLHVLLWFDQPIVFENEAQRLKWDGIIKVIQAALPIDPDQPAITCLTRVVGSINGKNHGRVESIVAGELITEGEARELQQQLSSQPFKTVLTILCGEDRVLPCPCCEAEGSTLSALEKCGLCYGSCGKISLEAIYDLLLSPRLKGGR